MQRNYRATTTAIFTATVLMFLTGCASVGDPGSSVPVTGDTASAAVATETPTSTSEVADVEPLVTDPPASEQEAIAYAETALENWLIIDGDILSNTPDDTSRATDYAAGQELEDLNQIIADSRENGFDFDGRVTITIDKNQSTTTPRTNGEESMDYASVHLYGCKDLTTMNGVSKKTGEPIKYEGDADGYPVHINVIYDPPTGRWLVNETFQDWENEATRC